MLLKLNNETFDFFNKTSVDLRYNTIASTFQFSAFFDPDNDQHRRLFRPLTFPTVQIKEGRKTLLTGFAVNNTFSVTSKLQLAQFTGYSTPGILEDVNVPVDQYPIEYSGLNLVQLTQKLIGPFNLTLIVDQVAQEEAEKVIEQINIEPGKKIKDFISEIAAQRNLIFTHDPFGRIRLTKTLASEAPSVFYVEGMPGTKFQLQTRGQAMHSPYTVQKQTDISSDNAGEETLDNPFVGQFRPRVKIQNTGNDVDTVQAVQNAVANELRNIVLTITMDRWLWIRNNRTRIVEPNAVISVDLPNLFLKRRTRFFVERAVLSGDERQQQAVLTCVLPEVYNGQDPRNIFV